MKRILPWSFLFLLLTPVLAQQKQSPMEHIHGVGHVHMDVSCSTPVTADFDFALALLHNFWYPRALWVSLNDFIEGFQRAGVPEIV